jgi:tRNA (guanine-N7-)-methyltransferase
MYWNFTDILKKPGSGRFSLSDGTIIVEIGFGNGEYVEHLARARTDALIVGIDVSQWCVAKAARRTIARGLKNVRLIHGDARHLLSYAFEPGSVSEAYMNFPCPWPKRRHAERRVASSRFAAIIRSSLKEGGSFTLATDVDWYANDAQRTFSSFAEFEVSEAERNPKRDYLTKYERKWIRMGRDTYMVTAKKITGYFPETSNEGEEEEPLASSAQAWEALGPRERLLRTKGQVIREKNYTVIFRDVFFSDGETALVSVISVDEGFDQRYYVKVSITKTGEMRGKLDAIGSPYKTPGVRASLRFLTRAAGVVF